MTTLLARPMMSLLVLVLIQVCLLSNRVVVAYNIGQHVTDGGGNTGGMNDRRGVRGLKVGPTPSSKGKGKMKSKKGSMKMSKKSSKSKSSKSKKGPSGKGKGGGGGKGKGGGGKGSGGDCTTMSVYIKRSDVNDKFVTVELGPVLVLGGLDSLPFYDLETDEQIGTYTDSSTFYGPIQTSECVCTGAYSFGDSNSTLYQSQINVAFTCRSAVNAITGGSGDYCGASGYVSFPPDQNNETVITDFTVCGSGSCEAH